MRIIIFNLVAQSSQYDKFMHIYVEKFQQGKNRSRKSIVNIGSISSDQQQQKKETEQQLSSFSAVMVCTCLGNRVVQGGIALLK